MQCTENLPMRDVVQQHTKLDSTPTTLSVIVVRDETTTLTTLNEHEEKSNKNKKATHIM